MVNFESYSVHIGSWSKIPRLSEIIPAAVLLIVQICQTRFLVLLP